MTFATREEAGQKLGQALVKQAVPADLVLGLPRGGVVVAAAVARSLRLPLDVVIVRKIGHPWFREFAVGALAEGGVVQLDESSIARHPGVRADLEAVIAEEKDRLEAYQAKFRRATALARAGKTVLLVDDGLATGATMEVAVQTVRRQGAARIMVAVPVASTTAVDRLAPVADEVIALVADPGFDAVGRYYRRFPQTTDDEVLALLRASESGSLPPLE